MKCKNCNMKINKDTLLCPNCGNKKTPINKNVFIIIIFIVFIFIISIIIAGLFIKQIQKDNEVIDDNNNKIENDNSIFEKEDEENKERSYKLFEPSKIEKLARKSDDLTKNIEIIEIFFKTESEELGKYEDAYIYGKNNNSTAVEVKIEFEYYDKEGYRIERNGTFETLVAAGKEFVFNISVESDKLDYSSVKLFYVAKKIKSYETEINLNDIEYTSEIDSDENIIVKLKNNSNIKMFFGNVACLYYKDDKIIYAINGTATSVDPNMSEEVKFHKHELDLNEDYSNKKRIEYDNYRIILYSAYDSDSENY